MQVSFYQNDCNTQKEAVHLMRKHIKALIELICIHRIMYKCQYKSATGKKSSLCWSSKIHAQKMNNNIKIKEWTLGRMLVKMHDYESGLCNVPYDPPMPTHQSHTLKPYLHYFNALCKGRVDPSKENSLILHHNLMGCLLNSADYTFCCLLCIKWAKYTTSLFNSAFYKKGKGSKHQCWKLSTQGGDSATLHL